jgi:uncharacterized protein YkwD
MKNLVYSLLIITLFAGCKKEDFAQETIQTAMLEEVNSLRRSGCNCGEDYMPPVPELTWNIQLEQAAARHAKDMDQNNLFGHAGSDGSGPDERITAEGYIWSICGENVAYGYSSVEDAINGWKKSPGHCRNIMDAEFKELGAAQAGIFWVQEFGKAREKE